MFQHVNGVSHLTVSSWQFKNIALHLFCIATEACGTVAGIAFSSSFVVVGVCLSGLAMVVGLPGWGSSWLFFAHSLGVTFA